MNSPLLASLVRRLGSRQASLEFRWMKQALLSSDLNVSLEEMVERRLIGEPLQYILGTQPFGPLNLLARRPVLIPRPETEHWVLRLANTLYPTAQNPISLLDLGTGSGCIPLLLCHLWPPGSLHALGVDSSPNAIGLANDNAQLCRIPASSLVTEQHNTFNTTLANFLDSAFPAGGTITPPYNLITSNPPYIPWDEYLELPRSVSDYEDPRALFGGTDGLEFYRAIANLIARRGFVTPNALLALEVGHNQAETVAHLMRTTGHARHIEIWQDPWGKHRTVVARM